MKRCALQGRFARNGGRYQAGVGLIEVLVAVLVLSIGFLGVAALQARSLSTNNSAMARSVATIASYSIMDAMRADLTNAVSGSYNGTVQSTSCPTSTSTSTLAQSQLVQWCGQLKMLGVSANTTGNVNCAAAAGTNTAICTITIQFDDSRAGDASSSANKLQFITKAML
jgi:type IV pilus assembly protein PilV